MTTQNVKRSYKLHSKYKRRQSRYHAGTDGQTWRRLKRIGIMVFENLLAKQFFKVHLCCL